MRSPLASLFWFAVLLVGSKILLVNGQKSQKFPELNPKRRFELTNRRRLKEFIQNSRALLAKGRTTYSGRPYKLCCDWGEVIVIPPEILEELKNDPRLDRNAPTQDDFHSYLPGFQAFQVNPKLPLILTKYLTRSLAKHVIAMSNEADSIIQSWHEVDPHETITSIVTKITSRILLSDGFSSSDAWEKAVEDYGKQAFQTTDVVRQYPRWLRPLVHFFIPGCWALRRKLKVAREIFQPYVDRRAAAKTAARARNEAPLFDDSLEWFEREYETGCDPAVSQITLTLGAIHITTDLLQAAMFDIALHPELFSLLRDEIVTVLSANGLNKASLNNLKLMDSVLKESLRMNPVFLGIFRRKALDDITLKDGTTIVKGTRIVVDCTHMWSQSYWKNADTYDAFRFLRMRETPGQDHQAYLVNTSPNHLGFGHGQHACPGRFFAAAEVKVALCHLLSKYDWEVPEGTVPESHIVGMSIHPDPSIRLLISFCLSHTLRYKRVTHQ
ncbi:hypothetical protein FDECE_13817 [Fusarium decemcellulare]|nr:hypothetical protein FDECE_13817 [Fusarium decemcellulare]